MAALEKFRPQLETKKAQARQKVTDLLEKLKGQIRYEQKFEKISSKQQEEILKPLDDLATQLDSLNSLSSIETQQHRAEQTIYVQQLNKLAEIKIDGVEPDTVSEKMSVSNKDILVKFPQKLLATEEDLEAYLAALKKAYENEIRQNKKIVLS